MFRTNYESDLSFTKLIHILISFSLAKRYKMSITIFIIIFFEILLLIYARLKPYRPA